MKVVEEDELAGFAFVFRREIPAPVGGAKEDFINVIDVMKESLRGQGVGSRMVQLILEKARSEGICQVRAYCDIQNAASHALWMKNGFGISPVRAGKEIVGSYVTYRL